jgi:hypothetical protein
MIYDPTTFTGLGTDLERSTWKGEQLHVSPVNSPDDPCHRRAGDALDKAAQDRGRWLVQRIIQRRMQVSDGRAVD